MVPHDEAYCDVPAYVPPTEIPAGSIGANPAVENVNVPYPLLPVVADPSCLPDTSNETVCPGIGTVFADTANVNVMLAPLLIGFGFCEIETCVGILVTVGVAVGTHLL